MKIKEGFLVKKILDDYLVIPTGDNIVDFSVAVSLNESGAFLWQQLTEEKSQEDLVDALLSEYDLTDKAVANSDVEEFVSLLKLHNFLNE